MTGKSRSACRHHPVDWDDEQVSLAKREPRHGRRLTLAAAVHCPDCPPLLVYSAHLEVSSLGHIIKKPAIATKHAIPGGVMTCLSVVCARLMFAAYKGTSP